MARKADPKTDWKMLALRLGEWNAMPEQILAELEDLKQRVRAGVPQEKISKDGPVTVLEMVPDLELKIIQEQWKIASVILTKAEDDTEGQQLELNLNIVKGLDSRGN